MVIAPLLLVLVVDTAHPLLQQASAPGLASRRTDSWRADVTPGAPPDARTPSDPAHARDGQQPEAKEPPTPPHTGMGALVRGLGGDLKHLPALPNLYIAAIGGGLALAAHPLDNTVNVHLRGPDSAARVVFAPGKYIGYTPVQMGAAVAVFATGRFLHAEKASHFGMDLLRAQIVTSALTTGLKYAVQRERPDGSNPHSFPSGHASLTFATATVIERHLGWRASALGYTVASYVAASRLHDNRHYLSDVVFGAAVGAIGGRTVTQHGRHTWAFVPMPVQGGVGVVALRTGAK